MLTNTQGGERGKMRPVERALPHDSFGHDPYNSVDREYVAVLMLRRALHNGQAVSWMCLP